MRTRKALCTSTPSTTPPDRFRYTGVEEAPARARGVGQVSLFAVPRLWHFCHPRFTSTTGGHKLIATGSTDGTFHVWLQGDWHAGQTADYDTVASVESAMTDISHSHHSSVIPKPQDRTELEPLARLSAQTAGRRYWPIPIGMSCCFPVGENRCMETIAQVTSWCGTSPTWK